jgi:hypothetical protein
MKKPTKGWSSAVCVISIRARFTAVVSHRPVAGPHLRCFSRSGDGPQGRGYSGRSRQ